MNQPVLSVSHISKTLSGKKIIDDITFDVLSSEIFGFLGPNGAGKTTVMKMITGLLSIDKGSISICGNDIKKNFENAVAQFGSVIENPDPVSYLSGRTNLQMVARMYPGVTKQNIDEIIAFVDLSERIDDLVSRYSLGMKQRLGLAIALINKPKLIILDEPTNGLDPAGIRALREMLGKLAHEDGVAVFISSHFLSEMQQLCDRVAIINKGKLLGVKNQQQLLMESNSTSVFRFQVDDVKRAREVLPDAIRITSQSEDSLELAIERKDVPDITRLLLSNQINVFGADPVENSLEDAFLNLLEKDNANA